MSTINTEKKINHLLARMNEVYLDFMANSRPSFRASIDNDRGFLDLVKVSLELHSLCIEHIDRPSALRSIVRTAEVAKQLLERRGHALYASGDLDRIYAMNPSPELLSPMVSRGFVADSETDLQAALEAARMGGYVLNEVVPDQMVAQIDPALNFLVARNILDDAMTGALEHTVNDTQRFPVFYEGVMKKLVYAVDAGYERETLRFLDENAEAMRNLFLQVQNVELDPVRYILEHSRSSRITSVIKAHNPHLFYDLMGSGHLSENILAQLFTDGYNIQQSSYREVLDPEDIVELCVERLNRGMIIPKLDEIDEAFRAYGQGSLWSCVNERMVDLRNQAIDIVESLASKSVSHVTGVSKTLINYLAVDLIAAKDEKPLLDTEVLQDKWAAYVIQRHNCFPPVAVKVGPAQSEEVLRKIFRMEWAYSEIPESFLESPVFKKTVSSLSEEMANNLLSLCPDWTYLRSIRFEASSASRKMITADMGI